MWFKLVLFLLYLFLLFVLARLLETMSWIEKGNISRRLLDPMTMSVLRLKALLDQRGISYDTAVEKKELADLVEVSGCVNEETASESEQEEPLRATTFSGGAHFLEKVEDAKDSVWLVYVTMETHKIFTISDSSWRHLGMKLSKFGVNLGLFDCTKDRRFCARKEWYTSQLVLGIPQDFQKKAYVKLRTYQGVYKISHILKWIKQALSSKTEEISTERDFKEKWLHYDKQKSSMSSSEIRVVYFSDLPSSPLIFSALSVKFPGRVRFGRVHTQGETGKRIWNRLKMNNSYLCYPYVVIFPEGIYHYGKNFREYFNFKSMEWFLSSLYPSINDIFILSLLTSNLLCCFEPFISNGNFFKRIRTFVWCLIKCNIHLILVWTALITICQFHLFNIFTDFGLKLIRVLSTSTVGVYIRSDFSFYSDHQLFIFSSFIAYLCFIGLMYYKYKKPEVDNTNPNEWNFSQFRSLQYLFYPTASLMPHRRNPWRYDLEENNHLLEEMHSSSVSPDYIPRLPTWLYKVPPLTSCEESDNGRKDNSDGTSMSRAMDGHDMTMCERSTMTDNQYYTSRVTDKNFSTDSDDSLSSSDSRRATLSAVQHKRTPLHRKCLMSNVDSVPGMDKSKSVSQGIQVSSHSYSNTDSYLHFDKESSKPSESSARRHKSEAPAGMREDTDCSICLDDYTEGAKLCGLPCGHSYHFSCIQTWLKGDNHICPICKWPSDKPKTTLHLHLE